MRAFRVISINITLSILLIAFSPFIWFLPTVLFTPVAGVDEYRLLYLGCFSYTLQLC
jgi:hypothetical protein